MSFQRTRSALARASALGAMSAIVLAAACAAELPTAADIRDLSVADAENAARQASLMGDANTVYMLDGVVVTPGVARAVAPGRIAGVGVQRAATPGGPSSVSIVTHEGAANGLSARAISVPGVLVEKLADGSPAAAAVTVRGYNAGDHLAAAAVSVRVRGDAAQVGPNPLYLIDGVRHTGLTLDKIAPREIESVSVIKDPETAVRLVGPEAVNGLIVIRTKGGADDGLDLGAVTAPAGTRARVTGYAGPATTVRAAADRVRGSANPVFFIDGVRSTETEFEAFDPALIESVNVIKDTVAAVKLAGPDGVRGVVEIKTRRATP